MRRNIAIIGLVFLVVGVISAAYSTVDTFSDEEVVTKWDNIWPSTLNPPPNPENATFWGSFMRRGDWIELDLSFSDSVRVTVSVLQQIDQKTTPIFDVVGTAFDQKITAGANGTYQVDIKNEGSNAVDIHPESSVMVKTSVVNYRTSHPYSAVGILTAVIGAVMLILGFLFKTKKARKKP